MELLPVLKFQTIAYIFLFAGAAALVVGYKMIKRQQPEPDAPGAPVKAVLMSWNDILLLAIWALAFAAGLGLMYYSPWAPGLLEYFCWVLIALTLLGAWRRLKALRNLYRETHPSEPFMWAPAITGALLAITPYIALAAITLNSLYDEGARKEWRAGREARDARVAPPEQPGAGSQDTGSGLPRN